MSSSLSELRNFRLNKAANSSNGANPSNKLATGRKRIRAMSDSSDDDEQHTRKQPSIESQNQQQQQQEQQLSSPPVVNGQTSEENKLGVKDKEERFHLLRATVNKRIDSLALQDFLVQNDWDVQKAYDAIENSPKYKNLLENSPTKPTFDISPPTKSTSCNKSPELVRPQKKHKVSSKQWEFLFLDFFLFIYLFKMLNDVFFLFIQ